MMPRPTRATVAILVASAITVAGVLGYFSYQRPRADAVLTARVIGALVGSIQEKRAGTEFGPADALGPAAVSLFLESDTAKRTRATPDIARTFGAITLAHQLFALRREGVDPVPLATAPGSTVALQAFPGLRSYVATSSGEPAFRDTTQTVEFLLDSADSAAYDALVATQEQFGGLGLDIKTAAVPRAVLP